MGYTEAQRIADLRRLEVMEMRLLVTDADAPGYDGMLERTRHFAEWIEVQSIHAGLVPAPAEHPGDE